MKNLIVAAAVVLTASFAICTKNNSVQPVSVKTQNLTDNINKQDLMLTDANKQDLGQADVK